MQLSSSHCSPKIAANASKSSLGCQKEARATNLPENSLNLNCLENKSAGRMSHNEEEIVTEDDIDRVLSLEEDQDRTHKLLISSDRPKVRLNRENFQSDSGEYYCSRTPTLKVKRNSLMKNFKQKNSLPSTSNCNTDRKEDAIVSDEAVTSTKNAKIDAEIKLDVARYVSSTVSSKGCNTLLEVCNTTADDALLTSLASNDYFIDCDSLSFNVHHRDKQMKTGKSLKSARTGRKQVDEVFLSASHSVGSFVTPSDSILADLTPFEEQMKTEQSAIPNFNDRKSNKNLQNSKPFLEGCPLSPSNNFTKLSLKSKCKAQQTPDESNIESPGRNMINSAKEPFISIPICEASNDLSSNLKPVLQLASNSFTDVPVIAKDLIERTPDKYNIGSLARRSIKTTPDGDTFLVKTPESSSSTLYKARTSNVFKSKLSRTLKVKKDVLSSIKRGTESSTGLSPAKKRQVTNVTMEEEKVISFICFHIQVTVLLIMMHQKFFCKRYGQGILINFPRISQSGAKTLLG